MNHTQRIALAYTALKGTSIGDAFGESFFGERNMILEHLDKKEIPTTSWDFTDDTIMAIAVFEQLEKNQTIIQDELVEAFSKNHQLDLYRGYGTTVRTILRDIHEGKDWKILAPAVFEGMGSMGNGAAMRVCPIGAYYYDDLEKVKELAILSAKVTHTNIEGITGAIAIAIATAIATQIKINKLEITPLEFITKVITYLPDSDTTSKINKSLSVPYSYTTETIKSILGNGVKIMAVDTVPFSIWCAAHSITHFENALWKAVSVLGDRDTICAMVAGITIMSSHQETIPEDWYTSVEDIKTSIFRSKNKKTSN